MAHKNLVEMFKEYGGHVKVDRALLKRLVEFNQYQLTKNAQHVEFFGGMIVGVERLSFIKDDFNRFFDDVVDMDQLGIKHDIKRIPDVDTRLSISTDPYTNTLMWIIYKAITDKTLSGEHRRALAFEALVAMHLRFMVQLQWKYFKHPADRAVAQAVLNSLNNRYDLKINGSWYETIKARCNDALNPKWKHFGKFSMLNDADEVRKMINRLKGGIEQIFQTQASLFYDFHKDGNKVAQMSAMFDGEEGKELKALTSEFRDQHRFLLTVMQDKNGFIKPGLLEVIGGMIAVHQDTLKENLSWLCENVHNDVKIEEWVESVLVHAHRHLKEQGVATNDLPALMTSLRNVYTSSRASSAELSKNKEVMDKWMARWLHRKLHKHIPNARSATMLYLILRLMTREHFR